MLVLECCFAPTCLSFLLFTYYQAICTLFGRILFVKDLLSVISSQLLNQSISNFIFINELGLITVSVSKLGPCIITQHQLIVLFSKYTFLFMGLHYWIWLQLVNKTRTLVTLRRPFNIFSWR